MMHMCMIFKIGEQRKRQLCKKPKFGGNRGKCINFVEIGEKFINFVEIGGEYVICIIRGDGRPWIWCAFHKYSSY